MHHKTKSTTVKLHIEIQEILLHTGVNKTEPKMQRRLQKTLRFMQKVQ